MLLGSVRPLAAGLLFGTLVAGFAPPALARQEVQFGAHYRAGTIVIDSRERRLYYVTGRGKAIRYKVAVGKAGKSWSGETYVRAKRWQPYWAPPAEVKRDIPSLPDIVPPGPRNPMGIAALPLARGEYAIHGTNRPGSVGRAASYGCFRMYNDDIADLYKRVRVGAKVVVR